MACFFVFSPAIAQAATYYVATTGLDTNPGTEAEPFLTIQHAADLPALAAGDTVIVENGTYADTSLVGAYDYGLYISTSGSTGLPITFQARTVGGAVLDDSNFSEAGIGIGLAAGVHHIAIEGFEIEDFSVSGIAGVSGTAIHDISISQNHLNLIGRDGLNAGVRKIGINVPSQAYNFTIDSNTLNDIGRGAEDCDTDNAISLLGHDHTVTNNIFYNDYAGWMIDISDDGTATGSKNILVANNTFSGVAATLTGSVGQINVDPNGNGQVDNVIISNNISYSGSIEAFINWSSAAYTVTSVIIRNNLYDNDDIDVNGPPSGITRANNLLNADPLFVNAGTNDYHLLTGSPAISLAYATDAPDHDLDQESRPQNSGDDAGAYEYLTADDTGPIISEVTPVTTPTADTTPDYTFTTDEAGTIVYGGDCSSADTTADAGSNTVTFVALAPGTHSNCTVKVRDAASNDSNVVSITSFTIDTSAPTGESFTINSDDASTASVSVTLNITCPTDTWAPVEMAFGNTATPTNWTACAATQAHTLSVGDGTKTVYMRFRDGGENTTSDVTDTITLDTAGPTLSFSDNVAAGPVQSDTITAGWGDATVMKWNYDVDGTCSETAGDYSKTEADSMNQADVTNNTKYICLYAEDALGNFTTLVSANDINIDITAPVVNITDPTSGTIAGTDTISFTDDDPHTPQCSPDNSNWTSCTSGVTTFASLTGWSGISGGATFTLYLRDTDTAANIGTDSVAGLTKEVASESDDPTFTVNLDTDTGPTKTDTINVTVTDASAITASEYGYSTDATCNASDTYGNAFTTDVDFSITGNHTDYLCVMATDEYSNTGYETVGQLNTDNAAPTGGSFTINGDASSATSTSVTLNITCPTDTWSSVEMAFGNTASPTNWTACAVSQAHTLSSGDGTKTVFMRFRDGGGNTTSDSTDTITLSVPVDSTAPWSTADPEGGTYTVTQSVTLTCEDEAEGSGCDKIYYTTDGTDPSASSTEYSSAISISESAALKFFAKDIAGNSEAINTENYVIDANAEETFNFPRPELSLGDGSFRLNSKKTYHSKTRTFKFKGEAEEIPGGKVKIYKGSKLLRTATISASGKWDEKFSVRKTGLYKMKFRYYSQSDELVKETGQFKVRVDTSDPEFTDLPKVLRKRSGDMVWWRAKDNEELAYYKYSLDGKISKTTRRHLYLPQNMRRGHHVLRVKAYDKAGNTTSRRVSLIVR